MGQRLPEFNSSGLRNRERFPSLFGVSIRFKAREGNDQGSLDPKVFLVTTVQKETLHFKMWSALLFFILVTVSVAVCEEEKGSNNSSNATPEKELSAFEKNYIVISK